ncbi:MAG: hypothetical protein HQL56_12655 [Magnetococcales bacterium]|nr:hypothetical protein [Magnetococcales bacterium]
MTLRLFTAVIFLIGLTVLLNPVRADKPSWAGKGEGRHEEPEERSPHKANREHAGEHSFTNQDWDMVRKYYSGELARGRKCPPGLAKRNNNCTPPGLARKWAKGQPLPRDVEAHPLPNDLVLLLGGLNPNYHYVRVAADILRIAEGSRMVIDAIQDMGHR